MKNKTILIITISTALLATSTTYSNTVSIYGSVSCKKWNEERKSEIDAKTPLDWIQARSSLRWVLGYLSAKNKMNQKGTDVLSSINAELVADWTDKFCDENKDKKIDDAAEELFKKLSQ